MLGAAHTKAKMVVRSGSERFAAVRIFAFFLGMAGFIALTSVAAGRAARGDGEAFRSPMARSINAPITASGATMPGATIATGQGRADHCPRAGEAASYVEGDFRSRRLCGRRFLAPQFPIDPLQNMSKHWRSHARLLGLRDGAGKGMFGGLPASDLIRGLSPAMT